MGESGHPWSRPIGNAEGVGLDVLGLSLRALCGGRVGIDDERWGRAPNEGKCTCRPATTPVLPCQSPWLP